MKLYSYSPILLDRENYYKKKKIIFKLTNVVYILFFLSYFLYYLSLERCMQGIFECGKKIEWINRKLTQAILSSIIICILLELIILNIITKLHLIHVLIFQYIFYIYSHGQDFYDHGLYNFLGYIIIIFINMILLFPFNIIIYLNKNKKKKALFLYSPFLIFFFFFYILAIRPNLSCKDWSKGLNDTYIDNDTKIFGCQIQIPKLCLYRIGTYFLDISKIYNIECGRDLTLKEKTLKFSNSPYINKNTIRFGYPLTNKDPICLNYSRDKNIIFSYVKKNLIDMDNKELLDKAKVNNPEIIVDFSKNKYGELIINVNYNKTLSKERQNLENNIKPFSKNIMILYFDSVSRNNGLRKLKKTFKFIEKFMNYKGYSNKLFPDEKYHAFQFFKFHSFQFHTTGNYPKLFYGRNRGKNMVRITKYLKKNGYVTAFSNDMCKLDSCSLPHFMSQKEISDHEYLICDINRKHTNSMIKRCLYDKINIAYQLNYGYQFWVKYKKNRKFLLIVNNDGHEGTLEVLKYSDEYLYKFLNNLFEENLLKDSTILILSDHGCPMPSIYYFSNFYHYEQDLPMLYILSFDRKNLSYDEQYNHLHKNQQKFITAYDVYNTIGHLIYGKSYKKIKNKEESDKDTPKTKNGKSIFSRIDSNRTPLDYTDMNVNVCIINKKNNNKK